MPWQAYGLGVCGLGDAVGNQSSPGSGAEPVERLTASDAAYTSSSRQGIVPGTVQEAPHEMLRQYLPKMHEHIRSTNGRSCPDRRARR